MVTRYAGILCIAILCEAQPVRYSHLFGGPATEIRAIRTAANGDLVIAGSTSERVLPGPAPSRFTTAVVQRSADGGLSFEPVTVPGIPIEKLAFGHDSDAVVNCGAAGIHLSSDDGQSWEAVDRRPCSHMASGPGRFYALLDDGSLIESTDGREWRASYLGYRDPKKVRRFMVDPKHPWIVAIWHGNEQYIYSPTGVLMGIPLDVSSERDVRFGPDGSLYTLTPYGVIREPWTPSPLNRPDAQFILPALPGEAQLLAIGPGPEPQFYAVFDDSKLARATADGSWEFLPEFPHGFRALSISTEDPDTLIAESKAGQPYVSTDGGNTFRRTSELSVTLFPHPTRAGSVWAVRPVANDVFVARLTPQGDRIKAVALFGGSGPDFSTSIAVGSDDAVVVAGYGGTSDAPARHASAATGGNGADMRFSFVAKLSPGLDQLVYATYVAESGQISSVATGTDRDVWIGGTTGSGLDTDGSLIHLSPTGEVLLNYRLRGRYLDRIDAIAAAPSIGAWVLGSSSSPDLPVTSQERRRALSGGSDAYVALITDDGRLRYGAYFGGEGYDFGRSLTVLRNGDLLLGIDAGSFGLPTSGGAWRASPVLRRCGPLIPAQPAADAYLLRLRPLSFTLVQATYLPLPCQQTVRSVLEDSRGRLLVLTEMPYYRYAASPDDVPELRKLLVEEPTSSLLMRLPATMGAPDWGAFLGEKASLTLDATGLPVTTGVMASTIPLTSGTFSLVPITDAFVANFGTTASRITGLDPDREWGDVPRLTSIPPATAPGSLLTLNGHNLISGSPISLGLQTQLPDQLGDTRVYFNGQSIPLTGAKDNELIGVVPFTAQPGLGRIEVERGGVRSAAYAVNVLPVLPRLLPFTHNEDGSDNSVDNPAAPGSVISVFVHGMGPLSEPLRDGSVATGAESPANTYLFFATINGRTGFFHSIETVPGVLSAIIKLRVRIPCEGHSTGSLSIGHEGLVLDRMDLHDMSIAIGPVGVGFCADTENSKPEAGSR